MGAGRPRRQRSMELVAEEAPGLYNGVKVGEYCKVDIQVAINEGNRREDAFFVIRLGKTGTSMPFQQPIPTDFARYHGPHLHLRTVSISLHCPTRTSKHPKSATWSIMVRAHGHVVRFSKGWRQFSVDNHLREGHQLLFTLVSPAQFTVQFFDRQGRHTPSFVESHFMPRSHTAPSQALNSDTAKIILRKFLPRNVPKEEEEEEEDVALENVKHEVGEKGKGDNVVCLDSEEDEDVDEDEGEDEGEKEEGTFQQQVALLDKKWRSGGKHTGYYETFPKKRKGRVSGVGNNVKEMALEEAEGGGGRFTTSKEGSDDVLLSHLKKQQCTKTGTVQRPLRKKVCVRRPCWEGAKPKPKEKTPSPSPSPSHSHSHSPSPSPSPLPSPSPPQFAAFNDNDVDVVQSTTRSNFRQKETPIRDHRSSGRRTRRGGDYPQDEDKEEEDGPMITEKKKKKKTTSMTSSLSPAVRLLQQQGCVKFSQIVSKCRRRPVSDKERSRVVKAARRFAAALTNEKFVVVMRDGHCYHGFHLVIPQEILEVTGTRRACSVSVALIDRQKTFYAATWSWRSSLSAAVLSSDGWAKFALDHALEEGDACVFELVESGPAFVSGFLFRVHIFHVVDSSNSRFSEKEQTKNSRSRSSSSSWNEHRNASDWEVRHDRERKRPLSELGRPGWQKPVRKPQNLQPWTQLVNPNLQGHCRGSRGQRQFT